MKHLVMLVILLAFNVSAYAQEHIGIIKNVQGQVIVSRQGKDSGMNAGMKLYEGDRIKSFTNSSAGLIFEDGTMFSIGPDTEVIINKYLFQPKNDLYLMNLKVKKGTAVYKSGRMGKLGADKISIETPTATIGVRGTKFLVKVS